jgi:hypothetical protein
MALKDRLMARAGRLGATAAQAALEHTQHAEEKYRGIRAMFDEDDEHVSMEGMLVALVAAVRDDEQEDKTARDVFESARARRRKLGLISLGTGPLVGVATHIVELYCEVAVVCDLADLSSVALDDRDVAAHMLVLWGVMDDLGQASAVMDGRASESLAEIVGQQMRAEAVEHIPRKLSKRAAIQALADARHLLGDASRADGLRGVVFSGHRTKQLIKRAEFQLGRQLPPGAPCEMKGEGRLGYSG